MPALTPTPARPPASATAADSARGPTRSRTAWLARAALGLYVVALAVVVLSPSNTHQSELVVQTRLVLIHHLGFTWRQATLPRVEMALNVVMVMPLGLLGVLSWPRSRWQTWTAYAFLGSLAVELFQGFFLPGRQASTSDIVANTLGALIGALIAHAGLRVWKRGRPS